MNKNVLIAFGGAVLIAVLVAVMMSAVLKGGKKEKKVAEEAPRVQILVAAQNLGIGQLLTAENVKWKSWPADAVFPGTITRAKDQKLSDAAKGRTIRTIALDEPVLQTAIVSDDGGFLAASLTQKMRAVAVRTKANTMAGGFINPGDYVDVILTYTARMRVSSNDDQMRAEMQRVVNINLERYASEIILRNVKVLGIDQRAAKDEKAAAKVAKTVTLEVDERGAEILALANRMGEIYLALRPLGDDDVTDDGLPTVTDARTISINKELLAELGRVEDEAGMRRGSVRVYSGGDVVNLPTR